MKSLSLLVFLLILISCYTKQIIKGNTGFVLTSKTGDNTTLTLSIITRGRYGFNYVAIYNSPDDFQKSALVYVTSLTDTGILVKRYIPMNASVFFPTVFQGRDTFLITPKDKNEYPVPALYHEMRYQLILKRADFVRQFGNKFNVTIAFSRHDSLNDKTFTRLSSLESYSYETSISTADDKFKIKTVSRRYEYFDYWIFFFGLIIYGAIFILLCIFSQRMPLKSRGILPYISIFVQFLDLASGFPHFWFSLELAKSRCIINVFVEPLMYVLYTCIALSFFRYVTIVSANQQKMISIKKKRDDEEEIEDPHQQKPTLSWQFRIYKHIGRWYSILAIGLFVYITFAILKMIPYAIHNFTCEKQRVDAGDSWKGMETKVFKIILKGSLGVIMASNILIFFYDLYLNWDDVKNCRIMKIIKNDVFYFRLEIYVFGGIFFAYTCTWYIIKTATKVPTIGAGILSSFVWHLDLVYLNLFVLTVTIITWFVSLCHPKVTSNILEELLHDPVASKDFELFAQREFSAENVSCYNDIMIYEKEGNPAIKKKMAQNIWNLYLNGAQSQLEVNLPSTTTNPIREKMQTGEVAHHLFDKVKGQVVINLSDTCSRFILTQEFQVWKMKNKLLHDSFSK